jgi:hypothetical protein
MKNRRQTNIIKCVFFQQLLGWSHFLVILLSRSLDKGYVIQTVNFVLIKVDNTQYNVMG